MLSLSCGVLCKAYAGNLRNSENHHSSPGCFKKQWKYRKMGSKALSASYSFKLVTCVSIFDP